MDTWIVSVSQITSSWVTDLDQAKVILKELNEVSNNVGLKMNLLITKIMTNIADDRELKIGDTVIGKIRQPRAT